MGIDIKSVQISVATNRFIQGISSVMNSYSPLTAAGGVYALESSATPELQMTFKFHEKLAKDLNMELPKLVMHFFDCHINEIEIFHESRLRDACAVYITDEKSFDDFKTGFIRSLSKLQK